MGGGEAWMDRWRSDWMEGCVAHLGGGYEGVVAEETALGEGTLTGAQGV